MKAYLLTAAGVIFLSVIISLVIPQGKMNKSIVFVMRLACILVLLQPITGIFKLSSVSVDSPMYDYEYICNVYSDNQSVQLEKLLLKQFSIECECNVDIIYNEGDFKVNGVTVALNAEDEKIIKEIYAYLEDLKYINITVYAKSD